MSDQASGHSITWEFNVDHVRAIVVCHEPEGSDCRLSGFPDCQCETWTIERDPDDTPYHMCGEERHEMHQVDYCNVVEFLTADGFPEEEAARYQRFTLASIAITAEWTGDGYQWRKANQ